MPPMAMTAPAIGMEANTALPLPCLRRLQQEFRHHAVVNSYPGETKYGCSFGCCAKCCRYAHSCSLAAETYCGSSACSTC